MYLIEYVRFSYVQIQWVRMVTLYFWDLQVNFFKDLSKYIELFIFAGGLVIYH